MSLGRVVMVGTLEASSRCGPGAAQPASAVETIKTKRIDFISSLLLLYGPGMLDRERELRDLGVPESAEFGGAHKADRERSEEHTSELQSPDHLVCRLLLEKKNLFPIYLICT